MEDEEKNKEETQTNITNKRNILESESNNPSDEKTTDDFHNINHPKIKLNEGKIRAELSKEAKSYDDINSKNNNKIISEQTYYDKINRYLIGRKKILMLIILLSISLVFLIISIIDFVNSKKNIFNNDKLLTNNIIIFIFQLIYITSLIAFQIFNLISKNKNNFKINIIILLIICIIMIVKILLYIKNKDKNSNSILNFIISFCLSTLNLIILIITFAIIKMRKNEKQNIEEIINFTDIPQGTSNIKINDKKDNQIIFHNSGIEDKHENNKENNKDVISDLIEDENNKEAIIKNEKK